MSTPPPDDLRGEVDGAVHAEMRAQFSAYLEAELAPARRAEIDRHLGTCAACRAELEGLRGTLGRLGDLRATRAPGSFLADVQNQIRTRSRGRFFARRHLLLGRVPFEWVSLVMIVAMLVYYIITTHSAPTQVAPGP